MAFAQGTTTHKDVFGTRMVHWGGFTQESGDTGGAFTTGLKTVEYFHCTGLVSAADSSGTVTATTGNPGGDQVGFWMAIGHEA